MLMHATMAALAVFICFAGNYLTGQSMMERPLVVGLVTGILMGDMKTGILMGASLEAIFLGNVNIGGVIAAEPVTATTMATTFAIISNVETKAAMTLAVPIGMLAAVVVMFLKNVFMNIFAPSLDKAAREGNEKMVVALHYGTWVIYYVIIASISFIGILAGSGPVNTFVENIPQNLMNGLSAAGGLLPAVGFAMLMKLLWDNKLAVFYILGFVLTAYLSLPAVAVAVLGVVICVVSAQRDLQIRDIESGAVAHSGNNGAPMTKEDEEEDFFA
ncbi:TPA: PTS mannose/fructose/sorbose/N-acetylgalactosamine transporter subunit IIC [Enterococcus faecium]